MNFHNASSIFDPARSWKWRVVAASLGTTTGSIVQAMLARQPGRGPALGMTCDILLDGTVITTVRREGQWGPPEPIGTIAAVRDNMRLLADHCKLSDADREELFVELRKWVRVDYRAKSEA